MLSVAIQNYLLWRDIRVIAMSTIEDNKRLDKSIAPYWKCVYGLVSQQDPMSMGLQRLLLFFTIVSHLPVIFPVTFGSYLFGFDSSYLTFDDTHQATNISELILLTTGLSPTSILVCASITIATYTTLIWLDMSTNQRPYKWPVSWETDNNKCYDDMFCEPSRRDRVIRRPGNALSNIIYFFSSLVILSACKCSEDGTTLSGLILSDIIFGGMLMILAISSTIWHSCNAFWSHSVDLWSMDAVIFYLPIRTASLGMFVILHNKMSIGFDKASFIASITCLSIFTCLILLDGRRHYKMYTTRLFQDGFPLAVRHRLPCSPYVLEDWGEKQNPRKPLEAITIMEVYLFCMLPVLSNIPQWILIKYLFHSIGSVCLARVVNISLVVGWQYRIFERWSLDGCKHMLYLIERITAANKSGNTSASFLWTTIAAILSPTAILHVCTGITLLAAYCHVRSLEMTVLSNKL